MWYMLPHFAGLARRQGRAVDKCRCPWAGDPTDNGIHLPGCPLFSLPEGAVVREIPMTAEERRKLLDTPIIFNIYGGGGHASGGKKYIDGVTTNYVDDSRDADATERREP
jgi:hypothetical protein